MADYDQGGVSGVTKYWAAQPMVEAVREIDDRVEQYYQIIRSNRLLDLWRSAHWTAYAGQRTGGNLGIAGEAGELTTIELNNYGNLKQHVLNFVTGQRPVFEAKASNSDHKSQTQCILANALIETVMRDREMEDVALLTTDYSVQYGEGWTLCLWDQRAGNDYRPDPATGEMLKTGDVAFYPLHPTEVPRDTMRSDHRSHDWLVVRTWMNRYELIARYPELTEDIARVPNKYETEDKRPRIISRQWTQTTGIQVNDEIPMWTFFHRKCEAIPDGRILVYLTPEIVLHDGPMPYRQIPLFRMAASDVHGTVFGYTHFHDLLAPQYALNSLASTVISNQAALGIQNVWIPAGSNLTWKEIRGGLNMVEGGTQPPQPLQLLASSPETYQLWGILEKQMETLSGVNAVARGNPQESLKSGAALALVQAQAIQFLSLLQKSYIKYLEHLSTEVVHQYQDFGSLPHVITITGQGNREYSREFMSADIDRVDRITIQVGNPLMATIAGRFNLAEMMAVNGLVKDPEQLDMVLTTGRLEPIYESPMKERLNISAENERLSAGEPVTAIITDNHPLHIAENSTVLDSPEARENPQVVQAVTEHLLMHQQLWETAPASILAAKGVPPPPMMPLGEPGTQPEPQQGPQGGSPRKLPEAPQPGGAPTNVKQPQRPKNPMTGERVQRPAQAGSPAPGMV